MVFRKGNPKSGKACEKFKYVGEFHRNGEIAVSNAPVVSRIVAIGVISTNFFYFGISKGVSIREIKNSLLLKDGVAIGTTIKMMKIQQLYDRAALWAVDEFLKMSLSIKASNKIIIDMNDRKLCSVNDCINYIDINGHCYLDDKLRLQAAIIKIILSLEEARFSASSINVEVGISKVGRNFPFVEFYLNV
jgi:hypothetical protein